MPIRYIATAKDATDRANIVSTLSGNPLAAGFVWQRDTNTLYLYDPDSAAWMAIGGIGSLAAAGVAAGYKIARGVHQQAAASDTVVTGLATVVAVVISFRDTPTAKQQYATATIGDQAGAPAAGSILTKTFKSTLAAADDFTDNINFNWIAVGT